jgi:uncharacterized protein YdaT
MTSLTKQRIKRVFKNSLENVKKGKRANISGEMIKAGYSLSSAKCLKVERTKTWEELKRKYLNDEIALKTFNELAGQNNEDKDNRLKASQEIMKLNDRYPAQKSKVIGLFETISNLEAEE